MFYVADKRVTNSTVVEFLDDVHNRQIDNYNSATIPVDTLIENFETNVQINPQKTFRDLYNARMNIIEEQEKLNQIVLYVRGDKVSGASDDQNSVPLSGPLVIVVDGLSAGDTSGLDEFVKDAINNNRNPGAEYRNYTHNDNVDNIVSAIIDSVNNSGGGDRPINLVGHSRGAITINEIAKKLNDESIRVATATYIEPVGVGDVIVPENVENMFAYRSEHGFMYIPDWLDNRIISNVVVDGEIIDPRIIPDTYHTTIDNDRRLYYQMHNRFVC